MLSKSEYTSRFISSFMVFLHLIELHGSRRDEEGYGIRRLILNFGSLKPLINFEFNN
jgi:hypothetical protein